MPLSSTRSRTSIRLVPVDGCSSGMRSQYARKQTSCHSRSTAEVGRAALSVKMRAYRATCAVEFDAEPIDDVMHRASRLNGEPLYVRVYESHEAATADAIAVRCDLLTAGWMSIEE